MASVHLARRRLSQGVDKVVALKCLHDHLAGDPACVQLFLEEARLAARITHANVCGVFDFGEQDGVYYIAMEHLAGESLRTLAGALPRRRLLASIGLRAPYGARILSDACEGLHAAHELRDDAGTPLEVVHCDVSPHNIFVGYDGSVRILDFGVAKSLDRPLPPGTWKGKPAYVAPEQLGGEPIDRRSDVWSLGVCLWEMLTLSRLFPHDGDLVKLVAMHQERIRAPSEIFSGVPPDLDAIAMRALARDPEERYASARDMARDLQQFVSKTCGTVTSGDVEEWMEALFPGGRERRARGLRAERESSSLPPPPSRPTAMPRHLYNRRRRPRSPTFSTERARPSVPRVNVRRLGGIAVLLLIAALIGAGAAMLEAHLATSKADAVSDSPT